MPLRLALAIAFSLVLHGVFLLPDLLKRLATAPPPPPLQASLRLPPKPELPPEPLLKNTLEAEDKPTHPPPPPKLTTPPKSNASPKPAPKREIQAAQRKLSEHLYYPPEAIARGIEGEVRLILKLSASGAVEDVAVAASSGHPVLDKAAVKAAYAMGQLTGASARELILPVIFRLQ